MRVTCQLIAAALERIDSELYQLYKAQGLARVAPGSPDDLLPLWGADLYPEAAAERRKELLSLGP